MSMDNNERFAQRLKKKQLKKAQDLFPTIDLYKPDTLGITPLQWLNWLNLNEQFGLETRQKDTSPHTFDYTNHLLFPSYQHIVKVVKGLKRLDRLNWLNDECYWYGSLYKDFLEGRGYRPQVAIKFVNKKIGYGLLAQQTIETGTPILEYTGIIGCWHFLSAKPDTTYVMEYPVPSWFATQWIIDAKHYGNDSRFINHSVKSANTKIHTAYDGLLLRNVFCATQTITYGTEILFDYGKNYWKNRVSF